MFPIQVINIYWMQSSFNQDSTQKNGGSQYLVRTGASIKHRILRIIKIIRYKICNSVTSYSTLMDPPQLKDKYESIKYLLYIHKISWTTRCEVRFRACIVLSGSNTGIGGLSPARSMSAFMFAVFSVVLSI
jgi:hypothetical protein